MEDLEIDELVDAIIGFKKKAWAGNAPEVVNKQEGSKTISLSTEVENGLTYSDTYYGSRRFIGQEIVKHLGQPIWGMAYNGVLLKDVDEERFNNFLRLAISEPPKNAPFRGPVGKAPEFKIKTDEESFTLGYVNEIESQDEIIKSFAGHEQVFLSAEPCFVLCYHGGIIE
jgi:hypothetical protein